MTRRCGRNRPGQPFSDRPAWASLGQRYGARPTIFHGDDPTEGRCCWRLAPSWFILTLLSPDPDASSLPTDWGKTVSAHLRPIEPGGSVAVRSRHDGGWAKGFSIAEVIDDAGEVWYRIRRQLDGVV